MFVTYCTKCNRIFYSKRIGNYCRKCGSVLTDVPSGFSEVTELSINERYRLAYRLTNEYDQLVKEAEDKRLRSSRSHNE